MTVELGAAASTIEQDENGVTVDISTTSSGAEVKEKARFAYVIGADGGHSVYFSLSYSFSNCMASQALLERHLGSPSSGRPASQRSVTSQMYD